ncbi:hypothetical protein [Cryobacterium zhongshanensis]|uniref:Uncharacterized protein n=1 Tax=Cryobacterium zhongshanensis TaxID=2928153 RepID=A0AA41R082_9MICO|nr:hypothetical protein [Cryobacterium zhongshanensis]MCI4659638.1 hypothetical protein [Cryobacterium zhongshanensis]
MVDMKEVWTSIIVSLLLICGMIWALTLHSAQLSHSQISDPFWFATSITLLALIGMIVLGLVILWAVTRKPKFRYTSVTTTDVDGVLSVYGHRNKRSKLITKINLRGVGFIKPDVDYRNGDDFLALWTANPQLESDDRLVNPRAKYLRDAELPWLERDLVDAAIVEALAPYLRSGQVAGLVENQSLRWVAAPTTATPPIAAA